MANKLCPKCGEEYSDTYRKCPFCQEEEALRKGKKIHRRGRRLEKKQRSGGVGGVIMLLAVVIIAGAMGYVFFGEQIAGFAGIRTEESRDDLSQFEEKNNEQEQPSQQETQTGEEQPGEEPQTGEEQTGGATSEEPAVPDVPAVPLTLDFSDITIPAGEKARLTAAGGTGEVIWDSSNVNIATVSGGEVTGVAGGTVTITAVSGGETATCKVTITGDAWVSPVQLSLNKTDFTLRPGDPAVQMKIKGEYTSVVWTSSNTNVATVSESGLVKRVGSGRCVITALVDGQELECIVRVS